MKLWSIQENKVQIFSVQLSIRSILTGKNRLSKHQKARCKKDWSLSDSCATIPANFHWLRTILYCNNGPRTKEAVNHALITQPLFINQTWDPVSLELKDTEVRSYRTDPVQVRSWPWANRGSIKRLLTFYKFPMWDLSEYFILAILCYCFFFFFWMRNEWLRRVTLQDSKRQ